MMADRVRPAAGPSGDAFHPDDLFPGLVKGLTQLPNNISSLFQDTLGTIPVTADGDPCNFIFDTSGNGNHGIPTGNSTPPTYRTGGGFPYLECDGVDTVGNGLDVVSPDLSSDMDDYMTLERASDDGNMITSYDSLSEYYTATQSGSGAAISAASGTPSWIVDGSAIGGATRDDLHTALTVSVKHVLEVSGINLLGYASFRSFGYNSAGFAFKGKFYGRVVVDTLSVANAALLRAYMNTL